MAKNHPDDEFDPLDEAGTEHWLGPSCPVCRGEMDFERCDHCGGEGEHDEADDDPVNYAPGTEFRRCAVCHGRGGYYLCFALHGGEEEG